MLPWFGATDCPDIDLRAKTLRLCSADDYADIARSQMACVQQDDCIRCGSRMVNVGFQIYRCQNCGHEEKPEDVM